MPSLFSLFALLFLSVLGLTATSSVSASASDPMMCTMEYAPVCGSVQVQCITAPCYPVRQTFGNACMANAAKATDVVTGECQPTPMLPEIKPKMSPQSALRAHEWVLESYNDKKITASGTLTFEKNAFHAKLCNSMNGRYSATKSRLYFRQTMSTMMYCEGDIMSVEYAMSLSRARYMVGDDTLMILTKKGDTIVWKKK